jgi:hypothetical protein
MEKIKLLKLKRVTVFITLPVRNRLDYLYTFKNPVY